MRPGGKIRCDQAVSLGRSYRKVSRAIALPPDSVLAILEGSDQAEIVFAGIVFAGTRGRKNVFARMAFFPPLVLGGGGAWVPLKIRRTWLLDVIRKVIVQARD